MISFGIRKVPFRPLLYSILLPDDKTRFVVVTFSWCSRKAGLAARKFTRSLAEESHVYLDVSMVRGSQKPVGRGKSVVTTLRAARNVVLVVLVEMTALFPRGGEKEAPRISTTQVHGFSIVSARPLSRSPMKRDFLLFRARDAIATRYQRRHARYLARNSADFYTFSYTRGRIKVMNRGHLSKVSENYSPSHIKYNIIYIKIITLLSTFFIYKICLIFF